MANSTSRRGGNSHNSSGKTSGNSQTTGSFSILEISDSTSSILNKANKLLNELFNCLVQAFKIARSPINRTETPSLEVNETRRRSHSIMAWLALNQSIPRIKSKTDISNTIRSQAKSVSLITIGQS